MFPSKFWNKTRISALTISLQQSTGGEKKNLKALDQTGKEEIKQSLLAYFLIAMQLF